MYNWSDRGEILLWLQYSSFSQKMSPLKLKSPIQYSLPSILAGIVQEGRGRSAGYDPQQLVPSLGLPTTQEARVRRVLKHYLFHGAGVIGSFIEEMEGLNMIEEKMK